MYRVYKLVSVLGCLNTLEKVSDLQHSNKRKAIEEARKFHNSNSEAEYRVYTSKKICSFKLVYSTRRS